ncbi:MAG: hypothetical protein KBT36_11395 [Kurthia sp.]|nr:hypothetical protein [Candidatus Kurthia equi]
MAKKPAPSKKPKSAKEKALSEELTTTKEPGMLQKLFVWVLIPVLFALAIGMIIAEVTGTNVFEKAKTVVGSSSDKEENTLSAQNEADYNKQIVNLKAQLKEKDAIVASLQSKIDASKSDASKAEIEKKRLEKEITKLQKAKTDTKVDNTALTKTYEQMAPKSSAAIISAMSDEEAMKILRNLKPVTLAAVLEKMTPEKAAAYTELLSTGKNK